MVVRKGLVSAIYAYGVAIIATVVALFVRALIDPWLGADLPHATAYGAVALSVAVGGYRAAVLAMIISFFGCDFLFVEPRGALGFALPQNLIRSGGYLTFASLVILWGERMRRARAHAEQIAEEHRVLDERLRLALTASRTIAWSKDLRTGQVSASDNVAAILGLPADQNSSDSLRAVLPDDVGALLEVSGGTAAARGECTVDVRVARPDGQPAWLRHRAKVVPDAQGRPQYLMGTATDITDLKRAEETLRQRERQLRLIADAMPVLLSYIDRDRRYRFVNRRYEDWFRISTSEVLGRTMEEVIGPAVLAAVRPYVERAFRGEEVHFEIEADYPDGRRWINGHYIPDLDAAGQVAGICVLVLDVTSRKRAEEAVRQSEARLLAILEHLPVGVALTDIDGRVVLSNTMMRDYVGGRIPSRDLDRMDRWIARDGSGRPVPPGSWPVERALRGESVEPGVEFTYRDDDGREIWLLTSAIPHHDAAGDVVGAIAALQDITAHKQAHEALRAADRRKDEFLATLAHELRNPLAPIRNAVQILKAKGSTDPDSRWVPELVERQLQHMSRLLEDLLDVSRIAHDKLALRKQRIELTEVIHTAIETCRPYLDGAGHELDVALPSRPVYLDADPVRLAQVFSNLLSNAAKYTHAGGHIRLAAVERERELKVSVKDDGIGISNDILPHVFEMFSQGDKALESSQGGLGLGLSLVRGLLDLHGGRVEARSDGAGRGSEFIVHLPLLAEGTPASERARPPSGPHGVLMSRRRLLIVDDFQDSADSLAVLMRLLGHEVHTAYGGAEAIERAGELQPEVVVLDIGMPRPDGVDVCRHIREQPWGKAMTLIALTGWGRADDRRRTESAGFNHHMVKPLDLDALKAVLSSLPAPLS
jgi:PAS domain S-box-containing protein